jgi:hypothetical protein
MLDRKPKKGDTGGSAQVLEDRIDQAGYVAKCVSHRDFGSLQKRK